MKKDKTKQGEIIFFISLLCLLILIMFSALNYLESKRSDEEEPIVIKSNQIQSFLWILGNYSNQQSTPSLVNDTFGYNVSNSEGNLNSVSTITFHSSEVNYSEFDPSVNGTKLLSHQFKNCSFPSSNDHRFLDYLCNNQQIILFSIRAPDRNLIKINGGLYYSIQLIRVFKSTNNLKKALQKGIIIFTGNQSNNNQFKRGHVYLVTVTLENNLPLITNCDLKLDWNSLPYEVRNNLIKFFNEPTTSCILHNYKIKSKFNFVG